MDISVLVSASDFVSRAPYLAAWTVAIILAVLMVRRGGGKTEKLFLAGSSLMLAHSLASPLLMVLWAWLVSEQGVRRTAASGWVISLPLGILALAGFVCLVWAFWMRFMKKQGQENLTKGALL